MKKLLLSSFALLFFTFAANAQTATELIGKWKMVKWTTKKGKDKPLTDSMYQVFNEGGQFISIAEGKEHKGKWKLSDDNKTLTILSGIFTIKFSVDYFDPKKRVISNKQMGTWEYQKVDE